MLTLGLLLFVHAVTDHGVPPESLRQLQDVSRTFFSLPEAIKATAQVLLKQSAQDSNPALMGRA